MFAFKSLRVADTPLSMAFFSTANVNLLQSTLAERVRRATGYAVSRQSDEDLGLVMKYMFAEYGDITKPVATEVSRLNAMVLAVVVPQVMSAITQHLHFLRTHEKPIDPLPRAVSTSRKGELKLY